MCVQHNSPWPSITSFTLCYEVNYIFRWKSNNACNNNRFYYTLPASFCCGSAQKRTKLRNVEPRAADCLHFNAPAKSRFRNLCNQRRPLDIEIVVLASLEKNNCTYFQILSIFTNAPPPVTLRILSFCLSTSEEDPLPTIIPAIMALYDVFFFFFLGVASEECLNSSSFASLSTIPDGAGSTKIGEGVATGDDSTAAVGALMATPCLLCCSLQHFEQQSPVALLPC